MAGLALLLALLLGQAGALGEPGLLHDGEAGEPVLAVLGRRGCACGMRTQAGPVEAGGALEALAPLGLDAGPELEDGQVLGPEDEITPEVIRRRRGRLLGEVGEAGEAHEGVAGWRWVVGCAVLRRRGCCVVVIVWPIRSQFASGQQHRQPLQFPDLPLAPLACR